jgi:beta-lactamase superfamily II metal-dependent hydrolase
MRMTFACLLLLLLAVGVSPAPRTHDALEIYVIDVEGGKSTLVVSPSGESMLIDTGNIGDGAQRDADRIMAAVADAGLQRIDHLVTTHWHRDHVGAMASIANRIPIQDFIDHGPNVQPDPAIDTFLRRTYPHLYHRSTHIVVRAGDTIPIAGLDVRVVTSAGATIQAPLPGAGDPNSLCTRVRPPAADKTENGQSIGLHLVFGRFRALDLGDVTINQEFALMCPDNRIGAVDLFMVSHHGQPSSNSKVLVHALNARVAIMNNGIHKGGQPQVMEVLHSAPGLEDLWQLHASQLTGQEYAVPGVFIANLEAPIHNGPAHWLKVSALSDGSFSVTNTRNGFTKLYGAMAHDR